MAVDLNNNRSASQRGWGSGWPNCQGNRMATILVNNPDGSVAAKVSVRREVAELLDLILDSCERDGYNVFAAQTGGFNCRPIGGTSTPSNHSWGLATDVNWQINPQRRPLTTNIPGWMVQRFARYGWRWGGYWNLPDAMHFEFMGTPTDAAQMTALARTELGRPEDDMDGRQNRMLEEIHSQMFGPWDTFRYGDKGPKMTLVDFVRSIDRELNTRFDLTGRPSAGPDTPVGHVLNLAKQLADALAALDADTVAPPK